MRSFCFFLPFFRVFFRLLHICAVVWQVWIWRYAQYGFKAQVAVMARLSGKIIGTKLHTRVITVFHKIVRPCFHQFRIFLKQSRRTLQILFHCSQTQKHISRFLYRHLTWKLFFRIIIFTVPLPICNRISAYIMRHKVILPFFWFSVFYYWTQHCFNKFRIIFQEQRHRRISKVYCSHAAVWFTLLWQKY